MDRTSLRVQDRVLTKVCHGFTRPALVGHHLFPIVPVDDPSGKIIRFGKEQFRTMDTERAPGSHTKRIRPGFSTDKYSLTNNDLDAQIPREWLRDVQSAPGVNLRMQGVKTVLSIHHNNLEVQQAALARDVNNYDPTHKKILSGGSLWSSDTSDPIGDSKVAKAAIRRATGVEPNTMIIPYDVAERLENHPKLLALMPSNEMKILDVDDFKKLFKIDNIVIAGSLVDDDDGSDEFEDVWGDDVIFAYVPAVAERSQHAMSYGYTYTLKGHPNAEPYRFDASTKSWVSGVEFERDPILTGMGAGYIIKAVLTG